MLQLREEIAHLTGVSSAPWRRARHIVCDLLRLPVLAVLVLCTPVVQVMCGGALLLGVAVSVIFEVSGMGPAFPFWKGIAISLGVGLLVPLWYAAIELLSRR